ncbi:uncharacterized protein draxinb [Salminus brasiliensis]|uniref:uncharacterized protein draxinb n=1 Tax=Salminus brasiliensis TaxID=930266 RepID=UPI003B83122C
MTSSFWCFGLAVLLTMGIQTHAMEVKTKPFRNTPSDQSGNPITHSNSEKLGLQRRPGGHEEGMNDMRLSGRPRLVRVVIQTQYDKPELEGLSPVRLEMDPGDKKRRRRTSQRKKHFPELRFSTVKHKNVSPDSEITANSKSHQAGYRELERHRTKAQNGREAELAVKEQQVSTVQMADLKEGSDTQQPSQNKGRQQIKSSSSKKKILKAVSCDHHLDCVPGSCCNLRKHLCDPHNRGLNNKCYDDCMCEEGLRCFTKFHHHHRVIHKKGRCVDPEYINSEHVSYTAI